MTKVYAMFEDAAAHPDRVIVHPALEDAYHRVQDWLEKTDVRTSAEKAAEETDHEGLMEQWGLRDDRRPNPFSGQVEERPGSRRGPDALVRNGQRSDGGSAISSSVHRTGSPLLGGRT